MEKKEEMVSLNTTMSEFDLEALEQRLETDPLAVGGLLDVDTNLEAESDWCLWDNYCGEHS